jgi:DedD protein
MDPLLKQRLIGAVVLVALAVIFIPMFLEGPQEPVMPDMQAMPEQQVMPLEGKSQVFPETEKVLPLPPMSVITEPVAEPEPEHKSEPVVQTKSEPEPEPKPKQIKPARPVVAKTKVDIEKKKPEPVKSSKSADKKIAIPVNNKLGSWIIQAGSFSNQENAFTLRDKLRKAGYPTQVERVVLDKGVSFRVRIGPYLDRDKAEAKITRLNKAYQLNSRVMSHP